MKKTLLTLLAATIATAAAAQAPAWLRNSAISPDGSRIAFTYKGDIFTVPVAGGTARQITADKAYDTARYGVPTEKNWPSPATAKGVSTSTPSQPEGVRRYVSPHQAPTSNPSHSSIPTTLRS